MEKARDEIDRTRYQDLHRAGFSAQFLQSMLNHASLWASPLKDLCSKAASLKVKNLLHAPTEGEYIEESAGLDEAIHLLLMGHHQSPLVTKDKDIVGILRICDVFVEISKTMKACKL